MPCLRHWLESDALQWNVQLLLCRFQFEGFHNILSWIRTNLQFWKPPEYACRCSFSRTYLATHFSDKARALVASAQAIQFHFSTTRFYLYYSRRARNHETHYAY